MEATNIASNGEKQRENARCNAAKMQENPRDLANMSALEGATPAMKQYLTIKMRHGDALLFYRMGDFYELFFDDAVAAAEILDIALTKRGKHAGDDIPMCGVPVHSHEMYLEKLIASGRKVAICEQLETPEEAKKRGGHKAVVNRDVVRIVTPGTITEDALLAPDESHYLAALAQAKGQWSLAWLDVSTGCFQVMVTAPAQFSADLARISPKELLVPDTVWSDDNLRLSLEDWRNIIADQPASQFDTKKAEHGLKQHYGVTSLEVFGDLQASDIVVCGALLEYLKVTQIEQLPRLDAPHKEQSASAMIIDAATRRNLELVTTLAGTRKGSLLSMIDKTVTAPGGRLLTGWLMSPLTDINSIHQRQAAVAWAQEQVELHNLIREALKQSPDMERAVSRLCLERGGPRDMIAIRRGLAIATEIKQAIYLRQQDAQFAQSIPDKVRSWLEQIQDHTVLIDTLKVALVDEPPLLARDGNFIASGYRADLDQFRALRDESKQVIAQMQKRYADDSGIATLKIKFNNVLGYFIDITAAHESKVPEDFIHRQTLANNLRYTTTELSETARQISEAADKALQLEQIMFTELLDTIRRQANAIIETARVMAECDAITALAELASAERYVKPVIDDSLAFEVSGGRHPVVEQALRKEGNTFIGNDCDLGGEQRLWLLTGPNMAGKSTFLRQNALITILAQMGSFVPAESAHIGVVDRLFSRVGAADDLARGRSTFMVEMVETATILNQSTDRSLVILDEIGRGTATFDGLSIAWSVVEYLHNAIGCRGLFATHYHELTQLSSSLTSLSCHTMHVKEWKNEIIFLHQVMEGSADRSYGIHVAQLAGLPAGVIARSKQVLHQLESEQGDNSLNKLENDLPLFQQNQVVEVEKSPEVLHALQQLDPDSLSPREALEQLYALKALGGDK